MANFNHSMYILYISLFCKIFWLWKFVVVMVFVIYVPFNSQGHIEKRFKISFE